jgi:hypothetical protein
MRKNSKMKLQIYTLLFCMLSLVVNAQDPGFPGGDDDPGTPAAPIDDWIVPMFIIGIILLFYYFKEYKKKEVVNH